MNTVVNWGLVIDNNPAAVRSFINGTSLRKTINLMSCPEAKTELYRLEKTVSADVARNRARRALARRSR